MVSGNQQSHCYYYCYCCCKSLPHSGTLPAAHRRRAKFKLLGLEENTLHNPALSSPALSCCGSFPLGHTALSKATSIKMNPPDVFTAYLYYLVRLAGLVSQARSSLTLQSPPGPPLLSLWLFFLNTLFLCPTFNRNIF